MSHLESEPPVGSQAHNRGGSHAAPRGVLIGELNLTCKVL
eukprot:SAG31_NODE_14222_length_819_cov_15.825000_1_plen_39_part_01